MFLDCDLHLFHFENTLRDQHCKAVLLFSKAAGTLILGYTVSEAVVLEYTLVSLLTSYKHQEK